MAINNLQVAPYLAFKTRCEYIRVALTTASLLSIVLNSKQETTNFLYNLDLVHNHLIFFLSFPSSSIPSE